MLLIVSITFSTYFFQHLSTFRPIGGVDCFTGVYRWLRYFYSIDYINFYTRFYLLFSECVSEC